MGPDTIIITGVTGQLGSYLADFYLEKGLRVVGFSRRTATHSTSRVDHLMDHPDFVYLEGDITDMTFLVKLLADYRPDYLVNTAAQSHVHSSFISPGSTWDITGKGAINVIDAVLAVSPETRLVQLSTSEMFGDCVSFEYDTQGVGDKYSGKLDLTDERYLCRYGDNTVSPTETMDGIFQDETTTLSPQSPYAVAKVAAHHYNRLMRETHNAHLSSLIAFNYESPRRGENFVTQKIVKWFKEYKQWYVDHQPREVRIKKGDIHESTIGRVRDMLRRGKEAGTIDLICGPEIEFKDPKPEIDPNDPNYLRHQFGLGNLRYFPKLRLGNLDAYRDWSHATDVVTAVDLMLHADKPGDYVVGSGETRTVREFLQIVCKTILGDDDYEKYIVIDPEFFRPAEVEYLRADPQKIKDTLGWEPSVSFNELVGDMCNG